MQKDTAIRLLIVDDRVEDAEAIVSTLRNGGIAVRPLRPQNAAELAHMVTSQAVDLVVAVDSAAMPLDQVRAQVAASGKDLPLLLMVDRIDEAAVLGALGGGARWCSSTGPSTCWKRSAANGPTSTRGVACAGWRRSCARPSGAAIR